MMTVRGKHLICIGLGNIGSHLVVLIARTKVVKRITLIDPERFEPHNLDSQDIRAQDVGRLKVEVMRDRIHRIDPELQVEIIAEPVERVPLGRLRGTLIATGLDGLTARRWVSRAARRLGVPLVDAGVRAEGLLTRIDVYEPSSDAACPECGWSEQERAALDTVYPCNPPVPVPSTAAPAHLGSLAASLQCAEIVKILTGETQHSLLGRQLLVEGMNYRQYISTRRRSPHCGFDHRRWSIESIPRTPGAITLLKALGLRPSQGGPYPRLRMHGDAFVHRLECPKCHAAREILFLARRLDDASRVCPHCGGPMVAPGIDTTDTLALEQLTGARRRLSLYALGLRADDVFSIENSSDEAHFEIGGQ